MRPSTSNKSERRAARDLAQAMALTSESKVRNRIGMLKKRLSAHLQNRRLSMPVLKGLRRQLRRLEEAYTLRNFLGWDKGISRPLSDRERRENRQSAHDLGTMLYGGRK